MHTAGELIVASLVANGIDRVFCVAGESYLGLLDALYGRADIDTVVCRHEAGAGFMALADARLTGRPGIACVSRGPGASNAAVAVHTAQQDEVPFILFVGQVPVRDIRSVRRTCLRTRIGCFVGDGGFLMTGNELAVALERKLPLKVIVSENCCYASIMMQQERDYPGRSVGTTFANPDLALIGQAFGFETTRIRSRAELDALPRLLAAPGPQFVVVETNLDAVRPQRANSQ
jgi:thiamine pyrophosphate-dependent acetolactate synthase large subunit-like protein